jgi:formyl-CoA transferase
MHAVVPRLSGTPGEIRSAAPGLGEHNAAILGGLGLDASALNDLRQRKVI